TQAAGPAGDGARPLAAGGETLLHVAAIGFQRGADALVEHPLQHVARADRELQLQQLLPHLLLAAAQEGDIAGEAARLCHHRKAEAEDFIDGLADRRPAPKVIAEIDNPVARLPDALHAVMQRGEPAGIAMNRGNRPDAPGATQAGEALATARFR